MNLLHKKFVIRTAGVFLLTIILAWKLKSIRDLYALPIFYHLFARYDLPAAILLIVILLIGILLALKTKGHWVDRCLIFIGNNPFRIAVSVFTILSIGAYYVYCHYPLCMDEYMPYFQARIFAEGKLWGQFPPKLVPWLLRPQFYSIYSAETGRVVSDYWPGFALLLTPFMKLGIPWLLNPIISSGTLLLLFYYMRKIFPDVIAASWGVLLTVSSSVFMVNGISYYSMSAHLFLNLLYAILLLKISPFRLFLAGLVGSLALVLSNPVPHIAFALPWILWIGWKKKRIQNIGMLFAGYLPLSLLLGFGCVWLKLFIVKNGIAAVSNYVIDGPQFIRTQANTVSLKDSHVFAFLFVKAFELIKSVLRFPDTALLWARLLSCLKLFAWSIPGLPLLAILGIRHAKRSPHLKLWGWSAGLTFFIHLFVPLRSGAWLGISLFPCCVACTSSYVRSFFNRNGIKGGCFLEKVNMHHIPTEHRSLHRFKVLSSPPVYRPAPCSITEPRME